MKTIDILNLGAGWQSTRLFLHACRGELPKFTAAVFADTQWEPKAVYKHLEWLKSLAIMFKIPIHVVTKGNLRADAIEFRENRASSDGKRFASIPVFVKRLDGKQGKVKRQCTREYKIEPVDRCIRRDILGLKHGQRIPKDVLIRQWFGISCDEGTRAVFPGRWQEKKKFFKDMFGDPAYTTLKKWVPSQRREHVYPLLNQIWRADRTIIDYPFFDRQQDREDCGAWLRREYPDRKIGRSACNGCPFHDDPEWQDMKDNRPDEFEDACQFDEAQRHADQRNAGRRGKMVGELYVHRSLIPLRQVQFTGPKSTGGGCGTLFDGQDGLCGL